VLRDIVLLLIGFGLTTVLGGALGSWFQQRAWNHQHQVQLRDEERREAIKVFEELSRLLDRRLYRMRRLWWGARDHARGTSDVDVLKPAQTELAAIIIEWNDNLNRALALVEIYFGEAAKFELRDGLQERFRAIQAALEHFVREVSRTRDDPIWVPPIGRRLDALGRRIYTFDVRLLRLLREERLGRAAPEVDDGAGEAKRPPPLAFGDQGDHVRKLQVALCRKGVLAGPADGIFGPATESAVRSVQRAAGIEEDGIAGLNTRKAINGLRDP
jgi:Putative peptidoglycan binding domain